MDIKGKKLLILGGDARSKDIVSCAKSLGVYTIVTDYYDVHRSPAKLIADEYWNQDFFQTEKIAQLIRENKVNGVITGFSDSYLLQYNAICEAAGLPCYASKEIFETTLDKALFKQLCVENGVPTVLEYKLESFDPNVISENNKIIIKPVDNSGSRGIKICSHPSDFQAALEYSLSYSKKKEVVIEKFMDYDSFSVSYTIQDGVISLSSMNDRIVHKSLSSGAVTAGGVYPSKYLDLYIQKMDMCVKKMYEKLGVTNGVMFIQGFYDGEEFCFYEMGYRLSGGRHYIFTKNQNESSSLEYLINYALTGKMASYKIIERDNAHFKQLCCQVNVLGKAAKIEKIVGFDYVQSMPNVIYSSMMKNIGDYIGEDGTTAQQCAGIYMVVDDYRDFEKKIIEIKNHFHIYDSSGNDLILDYLK